MFSQHREEKYILSRFVMDKSFLDIGAYNGKHFSNTHALALQGWRGICLEPSPIPFADLEKLYEDNDKVKTIQLAIGEEDGRWPFHDSGGDAVSSFDKNHINVWKDTVKFHTILVNTITVENMFNRFGYDFNFINIDTEGTSVDIFLKLHFLKLKELKLICVEHDSRCDEILKKVKPYHFYEVMRNNENIILGKI